MLLRRLRRLAKQQKTNKSDRTALPNESRRTHSKAIPIISACRFERPFSLQPEQFAAVWRNLHGVSLVARRRFFVIRPLPSFSPPPFGSLPFIEWHAAQGTASTQRRRQASLPCHRTRVVGRPLSVDRRARRSERSLRRSRLVKRAGLSATRVSMGIREASTGNSR